MVPRAGIGILKPKHDNNKTTLNVLVDESDLGRQLEVLSFIQNGDGKGFMTAYDAHQKEYLLFRDIEHTDGKIFEGVVEKISF